VNEYIAAIDCARKRDRFVITISKNDQLIVEGNEAAEQPDRLIARLAIMYLDQWSGLPYREMVDKCVRILGHRTLSNNCDLLVDATGVGDPIVEMFHEAGISVMPIIVTGGKGVREVYEGFGSIIAPASDRLRGLRVMKEIHVPKADMVAAGQIMLENRRVSIAKNIKWADELKRQLMHLSPKNTPAGNVRYESDDNSVNDDIAFCYILTAWWALRRLKDGILDASPDRPQREWDPIEFM